jgi:arylsulfatase A-like enzyme
MTSIAVVVLDTLRKDAFDEHFEWLPGRRFEHAVAPSHWTAPVHASLFAGKYPSELGVGVGSPSLSCPEATLAERLSEAGYTTRAFSCNPYVSETFDFDRGFDRFDGNWRLKTFDPDLFDWNRFISETREMGARRFPYALYRCLASDCATARSLRFGLTLKLRDMGLAGSVDDDGAAAARSYVEGADFGDREFLFVNLMEAHAPYRPPEEYRTADPPDFDNALATVEESEIDGEAVRQAYDDAVRYLSDVYRETFEELHREFDLVVTLADHGELFGEHGAWEHAYGVFPELTRVPLVVSGESLVGVEDSTVSLLDVHATVLDAAGLGGDEGGDSMSRGRSLLSSVDDAPALAEYHGLQPRKRENLEGAGVPKSKIESYERERDGVGFAAGCYAYETLDGFEVTGDPGDRDPEAVLDRIRDSLDRRTAEDETGTLSDGVEEQLRDLGYA